MSKILKTTMHLPDRIQAICWVQFWAWIGIFHLAGRWTIPPFWHLPGWFPFLFYGTTWVGEVYFRYTAEASTSESTDKLGDVGRVGSLSLVIFSIVTLTASVTLPWLVKSPDFERGRFTPRPPPTIAPLVTTMAKYRPDLVTAWMYSHLIFAFAMGLTPFVRSLHMATVLVSMCGMYVLHLFLGLTPIILSISANSPRKKFLGTNFLGSLHLHGYWDKSPHYRAFVLPPTHWRSLHPNVLPHPSPPAPPWGRARRFRFLYGRNSWRLFRNTQSIYDAASIFGHFYQYVGVFYTGAGKEWVVARGTRGRRREVGSHKKRP